MWGNRYRENTKNFQKKSPGHLVILAARRSSEFDMFMCDLYSGFPLNITQDPVQGSKRACKLHHPALPGEYYSFHGIDPVVH